MHIREILSREGRPTISFEFFPPRTAEAARELETTVRELQACRPAFVSVTYGAGGATREFTHDLVLRLKQTTPLEVVAHLTCVGHSAAEIEEALDRYVAAGVTNLLALRGDPPGGGGDCQTGAFRHAADLVRAIRKYFKISFREVAESEFGIGVAGFPEGHPGTPNRLREMDHLKAKVDAGADYLCTQLFFDNRDFFDFAERCGLAGIRVPILAGVLPVTSLAGLHRMAELAGGARVPARLLRALSRAADDPGEVRRIGIDYATEQCAGLLANGVAGIHLYTLNRSQAALEICQNLGRVVC